MARAVCRQAGFDYLRVVLNTTPNGPEVDTLKLVIIDGDPLRDSRAPLNVVATVKEGRVVYESA